MNFSRKIALLFVIQFLFYAVFVESSYAYLNPGVGSYFLQLFIGFLLGGIFLLKIYWHKVKGFLSNFLKKHKEKK